MKSTLPQSIRLLLVDDDPSIREILVQVLGGRFDVQTAANVGDALLAMGLRAPDVLITDLGMDDGGGRRLLSAAADALPIVLRVVHSAAPADVLSDLVDRRLADAALAKTGSVCELGDLLARLMDPMPASFATTGLEVAR